jgi:RNA polymerase sporulation-specific sigma factor
MNFDEIHARKDFEEMFNKVSEVTRKKIRKKSIRVNGMEEDDIVQETLIKFLAAYPKYDSTVAKLSTYIDHVIENKLLDCLRTNRKNGNTVEYLDDLEAEKDNSIEQTEIRLDLIDNNRLNDLEKKILKLKLRGFRSTEIADILKYTPARVSQLWNSIKRKLKKII